LSAGAGNFAFRKHLDGGYTLPSTTPTLPRCAGQFPFLKRFPARYGEAMAQIHIRLGHRFLEEWNMPRRWALDAVTPFEKIRVLDPEPKLSILDEGHRKLCAAFPAFAGAPILERWGGFDGCDPMPFPSSRPCRRFLASSSSPAAFQATVSALVPVPAI
jgi:hypothetical protein